MTTQYAELDKPGIQVIQKFATVSTTVVTPTLVPFVVGPCYQVLEAYALDSSGNQILNSDAALVLPAIITSAV